MKRNFLNIAVLVLLNVTVLFADNTRPANIPQDWPEECVPEFCKKPNFGQCRNVNSKCHKINQQYDGFRTYMKDPNIWVVTPEFGKKYGMEDEYIDPELGGIEAASYKVENIHIECGFGGKADACLQQTQGRLEIYIDENKVSLPWLHPQERADWHDSYSSVRLLRTDNQLDDYPYPFSKQIIKNKLTQMDYRIRPFADLQTNHEAAYFEDLGDKDDWQVMVGGILGYKRNAIDGLTVISFFYQVHETGENKNRPRTFRLMSDFDRIMGRKAKNAKLFHTFYIPAKFIQQIIQADKESKEKNKAFFKQVFEEMKNK